MNVYGENHEALSYSEQYEVSARLLANPSLTHLKSSHRRRNTHPAMGGWGAASTLQYSWPYLLLSRYLKQTQRHRQCSYLVHLEVRWRLVSAIEKSNISHQHRPQLFLNLFNHYIKKKITVTVKVVPCWTPMRCSFSWFPWRNVSSEMQHIKAILFSGEFYKIIYKPFNL